MDTWDALVCNDAVYATELLGPSGGPSVTSKTNKTKGQGGWMGARGGGVGFWGGGGDSHEGVRGGCSSMLWVWG